MTFPPYIDVAIGADFNLPSSHPAVPGYHMDVRWKYAENDVVDPAKSKLTSDRDGDLRPEVQERVQSLPVQLHKRRSHSSQFERPDFEGLKT